MAAIRGVITAMVTPFDPDGAVDLAAARRLAARLVDQGSHGLVVAGTTGESPTLDDDEKLRLLEAVIDEVADRAAVICGSGSNDTAHTVELTRNACRLDPAAVLVVTPYYNKPSEAGLRAHFAAASDAAGSTPVVLYNIPSRTVVNLRPDLLAELAAELENVVAVKQANNDDLGPIEGLDVLAGNDEIFERTLAMGGAGGILVASHIVGPEMRAIFDAHEAGEAERARELDAELAGVYEAMTVTANPTPVKTALEMMDVIDGRLRLPMVAADEEQRAAIRGALEARGILSAAGAA